MHKTVAVALALCATFAATNAVAQTFADRGTLAFSADRLFGIYLTHAEVDPEPNSNFDMDRDGTEVGLLWQAAALTPYTVPRLSIDYFVIDHLSVGGTVAFASGSWDDGPADYNASGLLFAPRVGGAWMFNDWVGIWPRGGLTYYGLNGGASVGGLGNDADAWQLALTAEAALVLSPAEGFAFTVGPAFDLGLAGKWDPPGAGDNDFGMYSLGLLTAGVLGYLNL
jgi:hypothetical protein